MRLLFFTIAFMFTIHSGQTQTSNTVDEAIRVIRQSKAKKSDTLDIGSRYHFLFKSRCDFGEQFPNNFNNYVTPCFDEPTKVDTIVSGSALVFPLLGLGGKNQVTIYDDKYVVVITDKFYTYRGGQSSWGFYETYVFEKK